MKLLIVPALLGIISTITGFLAALTIDFIVPFIVVVAGVGTTLYLFYVKKIRVKTITLDFIDLGFTAIWILVIFLGLGWANWVAGLSVIGIALLIHSSRELFVTRAPRGYKIWTRARIKKFWSI